MIQQDGLKEILTVLFVELFIMDNQKLEHFQFWKKVVRYCSNIAHFKTIRSYIRNNGANVGS